MNYLPVKLLKLRKHYGYSQDYLAKVLKIDVVEYMAYENGRKIPDYAKCLKIANFYHINVTEIFSNTDDEVTLHEIKKENNDINYFDKKDVKVFEFVKNNPLKVGIGILMLILLFTIIYYAKANSDISYTLNFDNINRLSASETSVVYIDDNKAVYGIGSNDNKQISDLPKEGNVKVCESKNYTFILSENGTLSCYPSNEELEKEIKKIKNIVDIACGSNHLVILDKKGNVYAYGNNDKGQCNVDDFKDINKIFATKYGTIAMDENGKLYSCGEFIGQSRLKNYDNILDIDVDDNNLLILMDDGTVECESSNNNFLGIYKWRNVVDVACGNTFVAGLKKDGTVYVESNDKDISNEAKKWENIIAISSSGECLVAYDGEKIYAIGDNEYLVTKKEEVKTLNQVTNVKIEISDTVNVSFDKVEGALGYKISLVVPDVDTYTYDVSSNQTVSFSCEALEEDKEYEILITSIGDGEKYLDSLPLSVNFIYKKNSETSEDYYVSVNIDLYSLSADELEEYLKSIGVTNIVKTAVDCADGEDGTLLPPINGISSNQRYLKSELSKAKVSYNYCRVKEKTDKDE